ncbi:MAG TPA: hypothetical protein VMH84_02780 [Xanthobacteraceae bacterium]|nr:hypothetical protein [Xanthobacteraceae bacterium]
MGAHAWRPIAGLDRAPLHEARLQAHHAVQWLARSARAYVPPRPDDSHTNLGWDDALGGFVTHPFADGARLALRIADLSLTLTAAKGQFSLDGRTDAEARAWLGLGLQAQGLDEHKLDAPSPYEMPAHAVAGGGTYSTGKISTALHDLATWYSNANGALVDAREKLATRGLKPPIIRCWPHHFDLDSLISLGGDKTTGLGFSPGDDYYDEPYFYITLYPEPEGMTLPEMPPIGHTHTHEFLAAIALSSKIVAEQDQGKTVEAFILGSVDTTIRLLK